MLTVSITERTLEAPEFGRCLKVPTGTGGYSSASCTTTSAKGSYEWAPGVVHKGFTLKTPATSTVALEPTSGAKILCKAASALEGEYSGYRSVANVKLVLTGCERAKAKCQTATAKEGEIITNILAGELGVISKGLTAAKNVLGLDLMPSGSATEVARFTCPGSTSVVVRGSVIVRLTANKMLLSETLSYSAALGKQKPESFLEKPKDILEASLSEGPFAQYGLKGKLIQTNEEAVEANSVI